MRARLLRSRNELKCPNRECFMAAIGATGVGRLSDEGLGLLRVSLE